ncbi:class F sortase [Kitasatospora sp. NPDC056446]|uniref:class F sortase n=1 Tax=Kitasatospora sp. NPDC056446 TaxID=3345819 RepID=UPI0036836134
MREADTGPESAGAAPVVGTGNRSGTGAAPAPGPGQNHERERERDRGREHENEHEHGRRQGHGRTRGRERGRRRAAKPGPSILRRTAFGTAGLLCLVLGVSLALSGRETPVVRIEASGHGGGTDAPPPSTVGASRPSVPAPKPLPASPPTRLLIPSVGVDAPVTDLGLNADGTVQVPAADRGDEVGWYRNGPRPGEPGPAVLIGHYDTVHGPAVFRQLPKLRPGELITVRRADGSTVDFTVRTLVQAAKDTFPTEQVYGDTPGPALRLITCGGRIGSDGHWTDNIIVLADPA